MLTPRSCVDRYIGERARDVEQRFRGQLRLSYGQPVVDLLLTLEEPLCSPEAYLGVLLPAVVYVVEEIVGLDYSNKENPADMARVVEEPCVIFLLLIQVELVATAHDLGR